MQSLEKRIAAMEYKANTGNPITIIRRLVSVGNLDAEIMRLHDDEGTEWVRQSGETEQELIDRAISEVRRNELDFACLAADDEDEPHAHH